MKTRHKHRIIPGYEGGKYTEGNVVKLSIIQHAMWHFAEWKRKENIEDFVAWQGLAGMITKEEAIRLIQQETCRKLGLSLSKEHHSKNGKANVHKVLKWWQDRPEKRQERYKKMRAGVKDPGAGGTRTKLEGKGIFAPDVVNFDTRSRGGKTGSKNTNSQLWEDPLYPELGAHHFARLQAIQRSNNLPSSKENRKKVQ